MRAPYSRAAGLHPKTELSRTLVLLVCVLTGVMALHRSGPGITAEESHCVLPPCGDRSLPERGHCEALHRPFLQPWLGQAEVYI